MTARAAGTPTRLVRSNALFDAPVRPGDACSLGLGIWLPTLENGLSAARRQETTNGTKETQHAEGKEDLADPPHWPFPEPIAACGSDDKQGANEQNKERTPYQSAQPPSPPP